MTTSPLVQPKLRRSSEASIKYSECFSLNRWTAEKAHTWAVRVHPFRTNDSGIINLPINDPDIINLPHHMIMSLLTFSPLTEIGCAEVIALVKISIWERAKHPVTLFQCSESWSSSEIPWCCWLRHIFAVAYCKRASLTMAAWATLHCAHQMQSTFSTAWCTFTIILMHCCSEIMWATCLRLLLGWKFQSVNRGTLTDLW